ncbi:hypothetical protein [Desulfospira joergensenii]|uniref:hypothetical protein n=1 Tax=Desulfospira joergensenii TaxID=53329 RepID=UPI0003B5FF78|nr:hypothetical protein [Desulfospira joergensenii]
MGKYDSEYADFSKIGKSKVRRFRDYHDEELNHEDKKEFYKKNKKEGRLKRKNRIDPDFEF